MNRSEKLKKQVKNLLYWTNKLYNCTWTSEDLKEKESDREVRRQIETKIFEIKKLIKLHYGPKIGEAIIGELND